MRVGSIPFFLNYCFLRIKHKCTLLLLNHYLLNKGVHDAHCLHHVFGGWLGQYHLVQRMSEGDEWLLQITMPGWSIVAGAADTDILYSHQNFKCNGQEGPTQIQVYLIRNKLGGIIYLPFAKHSHEDTL